jgi:hypothetical protein
MADSNGIGNGGFKVIGTRPIQHDGVDKVTRRAKYGADYALPGASTAVDGLRPAGLAADELDPATGLSEDEP